ncbi:hypothetical protein PYCC9005_004549 [Savitreella phatthalungensis]
MDFIDDNISAYAKLEFPDFSFFIQTLTLIIGRKAKAHDNVDVHLGGSKAISRNHARIYYHFASTNWEVEVLGKNGCFVNDRYIEAGGRTELRSNDRIQIAEVGFVFLLPDGNDLLSLPLALDFGGVDPLKGALADPAAIAAAAFSGTSTPFDPVDLATTAQFSDLLNIDPSKLSGDPLLLDYGIPPAALHAPLPTTPLPLLDPVVPIAPTPAPATTTKKAPRKKAAKTEKEKAEKAAAAAAAVSAAAATVASNAAAATAAAKAAEEARVATSAATSSAPTPKVTKAKKGTKKKSNAKQPQQEQPQEQLDLHENLAIPSLDDLAMADALLAAEAASVGDDIEPLDAKTLEALMNQDFSAAIPTLPNATFPGALLPPTLPQPLSAQDQAASRLHQAKLKRQADIEEQGLKLPPPESDLNVIASFTKPPASLAVLIYSAISSHPKHKMTLLQICKWICINHPFYRYCHDGWPQAIRQQLSLDKAFRRIPRTEEEPGKGSFWGVEAESEASFAGSVPEKTDKASMLPGVHGNPVVWKDGRLVLSTGFFRNGLHEKAEAAVRLIRSAVQKQFGGPAAPPHKVEKVVRLLSLAVSVHLRKAAHEAVEMKAQREKTAAAVAAATAAVAANVAPAGASSVQATPSKVVPQTPATGPKSSPATVTVPRAGTNGGVHNPAVPLTTAQIQGLQQTPTKAATVVGVAQRLPANGISLPVTSSTSNRTVQTQTASQQSRLTALQQMQALRGAPANRPAGTPVAGPSTMNNGSAARSSASPIGSSASPRPVGGASTQSNPLKRGAEGSAGQSTTTAATGQHKPTFTPGTRPQQATVVGGARPVTVVGGARPVGKPGTPMSVTISQQVRPAGVSSPALARPAQTSTTPASQQQRVTVSVAGPSPRKPGMPVNRPVTTAGTASQPQQRMVVNTVTKPAGAPQAHVSGARPVNANSTQTQAQGARTVQVVGGATVVNRPPGAVTTVAGAARPIGQQQRPAQAGPVRVAGTPTQTSTPARSTAAVVTQPNVTRPPAAAAGAMQKPNIARPAGPLTQSQQVQQTGGTAGGTKPSVQPTRAPSSGIPTSTVQGQPQRPANVASQGAKPSVASSTSSTPGAAPAARPVQAATTATTAKSDAAATTTAQKPSQAQAPVPAGRTPAQAPPRPAVGPSTGKANTPSVPVPATPAVSTKPTPVTAPVPAPATATVPVPSKPAGTATVQPSQPQAQSEPVAHIKASAPPPPVTTPATAVPITSSTSPTTTTTATTTTTEQQAAEPS